LLFTIPPRVLLRRAGRPNRLAERVNPVVHCPQCGFLEFDEHTGCSVCGFQSNAALRTGSPPQQSAEHKLIQFPLKKQDPDIPVMPRDSAIPKVETSATESSAPPRQPSPEAHPGAQLWREELQQKMRQYRARRNEPKRSSLFDEDIAALDAKLPTSPKSGALESESRSKLDEAFKLHPLTAGKRALDEQVEFPLRPVAPESTGSPIISEVPPPTSAPKDFELPAAVQKIKQQRQASRRSELFQQSLLFEASSLGRESLSGADRVPLKLPAATPLRRFLAGTLDLLVVVLMEAVCVMPVLALTHAKHWPFQPTHHAIVGSLIAAFLFALVYIAFFTVFTRRTLGMRWQELTLVNFSGEPPSSKEILLRTVGYVVSGGSLLLGFLWVLFDVDALAWHDRISHTYPVRTSNLAPPA
jgi:uncharacterized RDD family membrane protein YckC